MQFNAGRWFKFGVVVGIAGVLLEWLMNIASYPSAGITLNLVTILVALQAIFISAIAVTILSGVYDFALSRVLARISQFWRLTGLIAIAFLVAGLGLQSGILGTIFIALVVAGISVKLFKKWIPL